MNIKTEITTSDIAELGLMSGLEIHQQLEGKKLFCNCPTTIRDDKEDFQVKRFLRASAGESGEFDKAALAEMKKQKFYIYQGYDDTTCLIELDEEPPRPVNKEALKAALQTAKLLGMNIVDQVRFMRKIVVNGSNTTGFQRTAEIAKNGLLTVNGEEGSDSCDVRIDSLCLEEDSCKDVEKNSDHTVYNLSRLGIPLLEIATAPDLKTPEMIKNCAAKLGMILRSLPNVKRGLGTIRQDVNISINKGVRVEIKGAQDLKLIPELAKQEMLRQHNMLEIFNELQKRNATVGELKNITSVLEHSESKVIKSALAKKDGVVLAAKLTGFSGITGIEVQAGRRYGSELSDHAKLMGVKGLFHSDELPNYGITEEEKQVLFKILDCDMDKDAYILIADSNAIATRAMEAALARASDFTLHKEVRVAMPNASTSYMRPMPGASRMYPETDVKPIVVDKEHIEVPVLLSVKIKQLKDKYGLAEDIVKKTLKQVPDISSLFDTFSNVKPSFIIDRAFALPKLVSDISSSVDLTHDILADPLNSSFMRNEFLPRLNDGLISASSLASTALEFIDEGSVNWDSYKPLSLDSIKDDVKAIVESLKDAPRGAIIGKVMAKYKGKVDGKELSKLVNSLL